MTADWLDEVETDEHVRAEAARLLAAAHSMPPTPAATARIRVAVERRWAASVSKLYIGSGFAIVALAAITATWFYRQGGLPSPQPVGVHREERPPVRAVPAVQAPRAVSAPIRTTTEHHSHHAFIGGPRRDDSEANALVVEAMRRLRRANDPGAAANLLDRYLTRYPDGALVEEAYALAIEAHTALDSPAARDRATQYLARFPHGRFAARAKAIVEGSH